MILLYNFQTTLYLIKEKNKISSEDIFTNADDISKSESYNLSIDLKRFSFRKIHLISFFFSITHSIIFFIILYELNKNKGEKKLEFIWYFYFLDEDANNLFYLLVFILNYLYLGLSIRYCCKRQNINESIKLMHFSIYCLTTSIIGLIFPSKIIINKFLNNVQQLFEILTYFYIVLFLYYLTAITYFRLNCYYVQFILARKGNNFCSKICFGLKILFSRVKVPPPNFIDLNNSFIYHSLSSVKDFHDDRDNKLIKGLDNIDFNNSKSFSLTET